MFPFFNRDFLKSIMNGQKELEMRAPNGGIYRFSTNAIDDETFDNFRQRLEEAAKNNDQTAFEQAWKDLTTQNELLPSIETQFKKLHDDVQKFFQETTPFFNNSQFSFLNDPFVLGSNTLSEEAIDKQIDHYQQKIAELQSKKKNMDVEKRKLQIQEEITSKKQQLDAKLDEFAKNLDNNKVKKKLTDEMTKLNAEIKQLEKELQEFK